MSCNLTFIFFFFFFNDTATTEIYTLSLHDALPISDSALSQRSAAGAHYRRGRRRLPPTATVRRLGSVERVLVASRLSARSEEHTSELQSQSNLVCRLLLEKKKKKQTSE